MARLLTESTLAGLKVARHPEYTRETVSPGILHMGVGGFHRAHQAAFTEATLTSGDLRWGIRGACLRSATMRDRLAPQDFLYTLAVRNLEDTSYQVIGAIKDIFALPTQRHQIMDAIAAPETKVISLTVTEKGYCLTGSGELDLEHANIRHDLENPDVPISMPGLLAAGLKQRMKAHAGPVSIVSCDNLSGNGQATKQAVLGMAEAQSHSLGHQSEAWIRDNTCFPNTMVDRIVPQTRPTDIREFERITDFTDKGLVTCEPYSQWVIEDQFAADRPAWEIAGARLVKDVAAWELVKLRTLNATHTALACLGMLCGCEYIHETLQDSDLSAFALYLMEREISPVTTCPPDLDLTAYRRSVLERFANTAIHYPVAQVASDSSQKLPQRIYPTLAAHIRTGSIARARGLVTVVAAWLHCMANPTLAKRISDEPAAAMLANAGGEPARAARSGSSLLGELGQNQAFVEQLANICQLLNQEDARGQIRHLMQSAD